MRMTKCTTTCGATWRWIVAVCLACLVLPVLASAQTELAYVSGRVTDQSGAVVADTEVEIKNVDTNLSATVKTNQDGLYTFPSLRPGRYQIVAEKSGFKRVTLTQFSLNAQDNVSRDFVLQVGSASENVTVTAETLNINTTDAAVSTVVDRQFADNLPLNGRSFQSLIELTPGVLPTGGEGLGSALRRHSRLSPLLHSGCILRFAPNSDFCDWSLHLVEKT